VKIHHKLNQKMKNAIKLGLAALAISVSLASCFGDDKPKDGIDTSKTSVKIDTASTTKVDTAGNDTTTKKTSTKTTTTESKKN
jgi:hypothetical protein